MNWKTIRRIVWFVCVFVLSITLIENEGSDWLIEIAGDVFGAVALVSLGVYRAIEHYES